MIAPNLEYSALPDACAIPTDPQIREAMRQQHLAYRALAQEKADLAKQLAALTGAAAAMLHAVHKAGGYSVFDESHRDEVHRAIQILARTVADRLEAVNTIRGPYGLPAVGRATVLECKQ